MPAKKSTKQDSESQISMANTKKEMLNAYNELLNRLEAKREAELRPEQQAVEKKENLAVEVADTASAQDIAREVAALKSSITSMLNEITDKLETEVDRYQQVKKAVDVREKELHEIYGIERAASSLSALLQAQKERRDGFDEEMAARKAELEQEIAERRSAWKEEETAHAAALKERDAKDKQERERKAEEYSYASKREQQLAKEQFEYEKTRMERDLVLKREEMEKDLTEREQKVAAQENETKDLRTQVAAAKKELDQAVAEAVKQTTERLQADALTQRQLLEKDFEGQRNVLESRIDSLQSTVKEQATQIAKLSNQTEKAYSQVQDIASKAIEGGSKQPVVNVQPSTVESPNRTAKRADS